MDPYDVLGIPKNATRDEIKQAYRREAMTWHPDRCDNSAESKERFHLAAEAYRVLSTNNSYDSSSNSTGESSQQYYESSPGQDNSDFGDEFADSTFWDVMLDYAIKLARNGLSETTITVSLTQKGCPQRLAALIAEKAFNIHAHYDLHSDRKHKPRADDSSFKEERLEAELMRAFIGQRSFFWSPRHTLEYYLAIFNEFSQAGRFNPLSWVNVNKRLARILSFSMLMYALITIAINIYPGPSEYKLLPDLAMLQLPLGIASLMLLWSIYRKLWVFSVLLAVVSLASLALFNTYMPQVLYQDRTGMILISAICFVPFVFTTLFGNYIYYRRAISMVKSADHLFDEHLDKLVWIKNRAGTSSNATILAIVVILMPAIYLVPENSELSKIFNIGQPALINVKGKVTEKQIRQQLAEASQFFDIAETHFNHSPPDYMKAEMAYSTAADNGSILAAYKLGYMYYTGEGVDQNDILAIENFERAIRAPLAFQPHSLHLTTEFLAESYNNLGVMYQYGHGTRKDLPKARKMFQKGVEFGSGNARINLKSVNRPVNSTERISLLYPKY